MGRRGAEFIDMLPLKYGTEYYVYVSHLFSWGSPWLSLQLNMRAGVQPRPKARTHLASSPLIDRGLLTECLLIVHMKRIRGHEVFTPSSTGFAKEKIQGNKIKQDVVGELWGLRVNLGFPPFKLYIFPLDLCNRLINPFQINALRGLFLAGTPAKWGDL